MTRPSTPWLQALRTAHLVMAMVLVTPLAWSDGGRVVVLDPEPRVCDAIDIALAPWGLAVIKTPGPLPEADVVGASATARAMAVSAHAGAVIWVILGGSGSPAALWVYDAQSDQLAVRTLRVSVPLDDADAAAIALSVKTILRSSPLVVQSDPRPPPAPPTASRATVESKAQAPVAEARRQRPTLRLELSGGARTPTNANEALRPVIAPGLSFWPAAWRGLGGVGVAFEFGSDTTVENAAFTGHFTQAGVSATARARFAAGRTAFEFQAGPSMRLTSLDGALFAAPVHSLRLNPAFDVGGVFDVALAPNVRVGALAGVSAQLRFQRYTADNGATLLFEEPAVDVLMGLRMSVEVE